MALPVVDTNQPQVKELISAGVKDIANMIFKSASVSITAAAKAVTPSIPEMVADITEDLRAGPINRFTQGLEKLDKLLQPLHSALFIESNPSPVKYAASLLGMCNPSVRLPLVEIKEETKKKVSAALKAAKLL